MIMTINCKFIFKMLNKTSMNYKYHNLRRNIHQTIIRKCYDGEGKTTATILNNEADFGLMIDGYSEVGFRLNNNVTVLGPMLIFPRSVLSWAVTNVSQITNDSMCLFTVLEPKIDIVVIGIGDPIQNSSYSKNILKFMRKHNLSLEILPTAQACAAYNFLNSEGRYVVGAMIPPKKIEVTDDEMLRSKLRYQNLYETD
ncbi:hypothetical protein HHI36_004938 [Cryptolaemus montrouzieri]|uniref:NADH dehydrogenase [ubiquinone] 1 alpha subcomplex assembly factor 3 n=1 Tax=Cryptolaemus montrouzieri TaxID=559131 RepID=A0ABD2NSZ3_9CUCU